MRCRSCGTDKVKRFKGELAIHFPFKLGVDNPAIFVFPQLAVCLNCGFTEFTVPDHELRVLMAEPTDASSN